jgi:hypothetical protein
MRIRTLVIAGFSLLLAAATVVAAAGQKEHALKVGKRGEITLSQQAKVGDRELEPGTYVVQHRAAHGDHFVRFLELKQVEYSTTEITNTYTEEHNAGEIKCRVEPASATIRETTVYTVNEGNKLRITKVAIRGENVVHLF